VKKITEAVLDANKAIYL